MSQRVKDKVALVFGAGSSGPGWGNGKAAAALYACEGARVYAVDVRAEAAEETRRVIEAEGGQCAALVADVTQSAQIQAVVARVLDEAGRIDILHNNVGITEMGGPIEASEESWHRVLDTNLTGVFLTCKHVLPAMLAQGGGSIINISSLASIQVNTYPYTSYYAAKAGLNHLTRSLAVRYAPDNIRVNAVLPGVIDTPLIYQQIAGQFQDVEAMRQRRNAASPMGRMGDAWDVAHAALFLASDEAKYITGVCLPVDGGKACAGR
ncbi:SDR family NAD(P)-dependent oxidoreductase [Achromobacter sp. JUb104]|uniref:SDR family NAD(P)-dependent oxidoreductase n=1 Tax=Achromobacter sp. JUb104 TaxID=2940590 RepID=UPI002168AB82|nr:SDR family NAD(P)-dependent oxidoreductase [Achromobacter sp. JUb104]MCS3506007.1 NAD(P)-dependent dehydrogenase (short-subunit alcohol dehydrogenase family) [Achromobacter sp. JUb104]